jgi:pilus assembly protein CpaF
MERLRDGTRKVVQAAEVQGMEGDSIVMQDIFKFNQVGIHNARVLGKLEPTGLRPKFVDKFVANAIELPADVFVETVADESGN